MGSGDGLFVGRHCETFQTMTAIPIGMIGKEQQTTKRSHPPLSADGSEGRMAFA